MPSPERSPFQFSIMALLAVVTVIAIVLAFGSNIWHTQERKEASRAELVRLGCHLEERCLYGHNDNKSTYQEISCQNLPSVDKNIKTIVELMTNLNEKVGIDLFETSLNDEGLTYIKEIPNVVSLVLCQTNITDDGLKHIGEMKELRFLLINRINISDKGLPHLYSLTNLEQLYLDQTEVTEDGVRKLVAHLPNLNLITLPGGFSKEFSSELAQKGMNVATISTE